MQLRKILGVLKFRLGGPMFHKCNANCRDCNHERERIKALVSDGETIEYISEAMGDSWAGDIEEQHEMEMKSVREYSV